MRIFEAKPTVTSKPSWKEVTRDLFLSVLNGTQTDTKALRESACSMTGKTNYGAETGAYLDLFIATGIFESLPVVGSTERTIKRSALLDSAFTALADASKPEKTKSAK